MIPSIHPSQLGDWLQQCQPQDTDQTRPVVLDVREPWELQTACVKPEGFELLHIPMQALMARLNELPRDRHIACLCHHGGRSAQVAYYLLNQGYDKVVNIAGGIDAWAQSLDGSVPRY